MRGPGDPIDVELQASPRRGTPGLTPSVVLAAQCQVAPDDLKALGHGLFELPLPCGQPNTKATSLEASNLSAAKSGHGGPVLLLVNSRTMP